MVLLMSVMRDYRLSFAIGPRAQVVLPTVFGPPVAFVERGVGRACGRRKAFRVRSVVLAQVAALIRAIHVVREVSAVPIRLARRLTGLHGQCAIDKARRVAWRFGVLPLPGHFVLSSFAATICRQRASARPRAPRMAWPAVSAQLFSRKAHPLHTLGIDESTRCRAPQRSLYGQPVA